MTPCPKEAELVPFKNLEVPRNSLQFVKKLGAGQFGEVYAGTHPSLALFIYLFLRVCVMPIPLLSIQMSIFGVTFHVKLVDLSSRICKRRWLKGLRLRCSFKQLRSGPRWRSF